MSPSGSSRSGPDLPTAQPSFTEQRTALFQLSDTGEGGSTRATLRRHYPLLKMGAREGVAYFADRLRVQVEGILAASTLEWVVTGPPSVTIPAAANLLSAAIFERIRAGTPCRLLDIPELADEGSSESFHDDYARLGWREREVSRARAADAMVPLEAFRGRAVLFVNDIRVTGAQERVMRRYFALVGASHVHWLYVVEVEESLGRREPQIEHALNQPEDGSFETFVRLFSTPELTFTAKGVQKAMSYDLANLRRLLEALPAERRAALCRLVQREPRYAGADFAAKRALLAAAEAGGASATPR